MTLGHHIVPIIHLASGTATRSVAMWLGVHERTVLDLRRGHVDPELVEATARQLHLMAARPRAA